MSVRKSLALAGHAIGTNLRQPFTWAGAALLVAVSLLGPAVSIQNHGVWGFDADLLGTGFAFGALFVMRSGLVEQRIGGLQEFLRENFVTPVEHMGGMILSLLATWLLYTAVAFLVALLLSGGDLGLAAWSVWLLMLTSGLLLPFVLMVECVSELRTPLAVPGFVYFATLFTLAGLVGYERTADLMALNADRSWPPSSIPLAFRAGASLVGGIGLVFAATAVRARGRVRRRRAADVVPAG